MKHMKTVPVPATEREVVDFVTCDLCKKRIRSKSRGDAEEIEVRHRTGLAYPDGGSGEETLVDLCAACFDGKLLPWLRSQGAEPQTREWDF
jgi:hypothetical protein